MFPRVTMYMYVHVACQSSELYRLSLCTCTLLYVCKHLREGVAHPSTCIYYTFYPLSHSLPSHIHVYAVQTGARRSGKERHSQRSKGGGGRGGGGGREGEVVDSEGGGAGGRGEGGGGGEDELPLQPPEILPDPNDMEAFKVDEYKDLSKGSFDTGDPLTTNLYVGNINPKVGTVILLR